MQKKWAPVAVCTLLTVLLALCWLAVNSTEQAWAADEYSLTINFSSPESNKDIQVLIELYEYVESSGTVGALAGMTICNTKSSLNPPNGQPVTIKLPKGKKYLMRVEPLVGRTSSQSSYQAREANYQTQFYSRHRTAQEAIDDESFIDTTGSATSGTKTISLEPGYKIEGSIKKSGSNTYIEGVTVKVYDEKGQVVTRYGKSSGTGGTTGANYTIYGLSPGKYYLVADGAPKGYLRKWYKGSTGTDLLAEAELIEIKNSDVTGKNFSLDEGRSIKGTLLDPDGAPIKHAARVYLLDAATSSPVGWCFYDPNSASYDELLARLTYSQTRGLIDFSYFKNSPNYFIGGLDPNYSIGGLPRGSLGECILVGVDLTGTYAPSVYKDKYFVSDADRIVLKNITQDSVYNLQFRRSVTIEGSVKDKAGKPLGGIIIQAVDARDETKIIPPLAQTDPNGRYKLSGLAPIGYKIQAIDQYGRKYLWQYYKNAASFAQATTIQFTDQKLSESHIDFELEIGGRISGYVRDASSNQPIPNITVQAFQVGSGSQLMNWPIASSAANIGISGPDGKYEISGLPMGRYVLWAGPPKENYVAVFYRNSDNLNSADSVVITDPNQLISSCDFSLSKGGIIQGRITGIPAEVKSNLINIQNINIHVTLQDAKTGKVMNTTAEQIDPNTLEYKIVGIPRGEYKVSITDLRIPPEMVKKYYKENDPRGVSSYKEATTVTIDPTAAQPTQIDFVWDEVGETLRGKVLADSSESKPLSSIKVEAYKVEEMSGEVLNTGIYTFTNSEGIYYLRGLAKGTYILKASDEMNHLYPAEFYNPNDNAFTTDKAARITLPLLSSSLSFDFKLNRDFGIINGVVTKGPGREIIKEGWVDLYSGENYQFLQRIMTDPNGRYSFTGLAEGSYKIRAFDPGRVYVPRFYTSSSTTYAFSWSEGESVIVKYSSPASSLHKDISLDQQGTQIEGKVSNESGDPLAGAILYLYQPAGENKWSFVAEYYNAATDSSGKYTISGLPAGSYRILAWDPTSSYLSKEYDLTLTQSGKSGVDFSLPKADPKIQSQKNTLDISEGLNLFAYPTKIPLWYSLYTANILLNEWAPTSYMWSIGSDPGIINLLRYNPEKEKWENRFVDFLITNGEGYIMYSQSDRRINYWGAPFSSQDRLAINLHKGMNVVGNIAASIIDYDSYHLLKELAGEVVDIRSYDLRRMDDPKRMDDSKRRAGKWLNSVLFWGMPSGDRFPISSTQAYIIDMKVPHWSWLPQ